VDAMTRCEKRFMDMDMHGHGHVTTAHTWMQLSPSSVQRFNVTVTSTAMRPADGSAIASGWPCVDAMAREGKD
jgi:calcineurin-like phosphoesterase family protein